MSSTPRGLVFDFEWRTTLFVLVLVPVMTGLGFWQLDRADEKEALAGAFAQRSAQPPAPLDALWQKSADELAYLPAKAQGQIVPGAYFLLDNRTRAGKFGYEVLGLLRLDSGGLALVNRGWVAGDASRLSMPEVPEVEGTVALRGHVYVAPGEPYLLAEQALSDQWPQVLQAVEMDKLAPHLAQLFDTRVFPYPLRLEATSPAALAVDWQIINVSPEKHLGYAVQWFTMAAVLLLFYILRSTNLWQLVARRQSED